MVSISVSNGVLEYRRNNLVLQSAVSFMLEDIIRVKEFDCGYLVVDAKYKHGVEEEYIDLYDSLCLLGLSRFKDDYFGNVRGDDVCLKKL